MKRISDTERITQYFMETDLAVAEAQLQTVRAILASRSKQSNGSAGASAAPKTTLVRRRTRSSAAPVETVNQPAAPVLASEDSII